MNIECPHCETVNEIPLENAVCAECEGSLNEHTFSKHKKPLISTVTAIILGGIVGHHIGEPSDKELAALTPPPIMVEKDDRYPVAVEYALLDVCINGSNYYRSEAQVRRTTQTCTCALEGTMKEIKHSDYIRNETHFASRFLAHAKACRV